MQNEACQVSLIQCARFTDVRRDSKVADACLKFDVQAIYGHIRPRAEYGNTEIRILVNIQHIHTYTTTYVSTIYTVDTKIATKQTILSLTNKQSTAKKASQILPIYKFEDKTAIDEKR